jgi:hypothetical protein
MPSCEFTINPGSYLNLFMTLFAMGHRSTLRETRGSATPKEDEGWGTVMARLKVISGALAQAGRRAILKVARGQPISSNGRLTFECGNCGAVVLENVELEQIRNCVIQCDCGAYNELADVP